MLTPHTKYLVLVSILTHKSDNGCRKINAYVVSLQLNDLDHDIVALCRGVGIDRNRLVLVAVR